MSWLSKLKSGLGKISLKRKPGGTFVGNFLRAMVNKQTDGAFGNGAMMLQEGETTADADARLVKGVGAGLSAFSDTAAQGVTMPEAHASSIMDGFKSGVIMQKIKQYALPAGGLLVGIVVLKSLLKRK